MKKLLFVFAILTSITLVIASLHIGFRVHDDFEFTNLITNTSDVNMDAEGEVEILSVVGSDGLYNTRVIISVEDLYTPDGYVFEGWLVDEDTGFKLSTGGFTTNRNGHESVRFIQDIVNFQVYDKVVITKEPINDTNPDANVAIMETELPWSS